MARKQAEARTFADPPIQHEGEECAVLYRMYEVWRVYIHDSGRQRFDRRDALRVAAHLIATSPRGWGDVRVATLSGPFARSFDSDERRIAGDGVPHA